MKPDPGTAEPRTEAGRVEADARLRAIANEWAEQARIVFGVDAQQDERGWFSPDAVADLVEQAATEARRELLAALRAVLYGFPQTYTEPEAAAWIAGVRAALAALPDDGREGLARLRAIEDAAQELMDYHDGGGFRANHPDDLFSALRSALTDKP